MAQDLKAFAERIKKRAKQVEKNVDKTVAKTALAILATVIPATPVDTGRARGNWQVSLGEPILTELKAEDKTGQATVNKGAATAESRKSGQTIYICNNVPYIGRLNEGSSPQAPAQFVQSAVRVAVEYIRNARVVE